MTVPTALATRICSKCNEPCDADQDFYKGKSACKLCLCAWQNEYWRDDIQNYVANVQRSRIRQRYKAIGIEPPRRLFDLVGCGKPELVAYLEDRMDSWMTWENYGKLWSVDHVFPLGRCGPGRIPWASSYHMLRCLTVQENARKGNSLWPYLVARLLEVNGGALRRPQTAVAQTAVTQAVAQTAANP